MKRNTLFFLLAILMAFASCPVIGQTPIDAKKVATQVASFKADVRGTYKNIRWFCADGTTSEPKDPCPEMKGAIQHATYKDEVVALGKKHHLFLGQILAYTDKEEFWDNANHHSRLKQYQLGLYLARIDEGWVNQKGQFYRGAIQIEDEEAWGIAFYKWLLAKDAPLQKEYFLMLQSLKDIPHKGDNDMAQLMRAQSKVISDQYSKFMDLRVKIHSNPEAVDIEKVVKFKEDNSAKLTADLSKKLEDLLGTMRKFHQPVDLKGIESQSKTLSATGPLTAIIKAFLKENGTGATPAKLTSASAMLLLDIRKQLLAEKSATQRLKLLDIANLLQTVVAKQSNLWTPITLGEQLEKIYALSMASAGTGLIELWEWQQIEAILKPTDAESLTLAALTEKLETARSAVEWGVAMVKASYQETVNTYTAFEPLAYSFIDDRIRSSVALSMGKSVGVLGALIATESALTNKVFDLKNQSTFRGLNPGYAFGELVVVSGSPEDINVFSDKIYVFERSPSDLKPVAGIATVAEGNLVSHVQLLARNLGIPNAALSDENLQDLKAFHGKKVFYAVSNKGNIILKLEADMSEAEKALFAKKVRKEEKISVPVEQIRLDQTKILNLRSVNASNSGKICGPKAANLGQLKELFPDKVVEGFVISFGIFREHMNQQMPNQGKSYWQFLNEMFVEADSKREQGISEAEVENFQLRQLEVLREAIKIMPLKADFTADLTESFQTILGKSIGGVPVFLRSDTNMEDLKDFTGAGLNLTIFNVLQKDKILQGIRDVWASPYTERSFKWRQKYLLNPENVFPSILVIPSVDVDCSGVMITKGVASGSAQDLTIAFSRGAGGAVDGQAAESYLLQEKGGAKLISPAREPFHNTLPSTGGTGKQQASFEKAILNEGNIADIRAIAQSIRTTLAQKTASEYKGAYDVELGFKENKLWLFQIRPFVENKKALGSEYLDTITPKIDQSKAISLAKKI